MKSLLVEKKTAGEVPKDATSLSRDGRPVLAVAPSIKHAVGVEVGASRSGATVYVEPHELLPLTAAQRAADAAAAAAEHKLLHALTAVVVEYASDLLAAVAAAAAVDAAAARAALAQDWRAPSPPSATPASFGSRERGILCSSTAPATTFS